MNLLLLLPLFKDDELIKKFQLFRVSACETFSGKISLKKEFNILNN